MKRYVFPAICFLLAWGLISFAVWKDTQPLPANQTFSLDVPKITETYTAWGITRPTPAVFTDYRTVRAKMDTGADSLVILEDKYLSLSNNDRRATVSYWVKDGPKWLTANQTLETAWPEYIRARWSLNGNTITAEAGTNEIPFITAIMGVVLAVVGILLLPRRAEHSVPKTA